jgi:alpha-L-rhamnosidase
MTTTQRTVLSCFAYMNYLYISRLADAVGRPDEAERFAQYAARIRDAIQRRLWNDEKSAYVDGLYADGSQSPKTSQQANILPLALGFTREDQTRGALATVKRAGRSTGPMLVRFLIRAYGEYDQDEALLKYLIDPEGGRNWAHILADGGTFTYENWEGTTSQSHPQSSIGGVIAVQEYLLGVQPLEPQYARVKVRPHSGGLKFAKGTIPTQRGPVAVSWTDDSKEKEFRMAVSIPCNMRADVYVPKGGAAGTSITVDGAPREGEDAGRYVLIRDVGAGEHAFVRRWR